MQFVLQTQKHYEDQRKKEQMEQEIISKKIGKFVGLNKTYTFIRAALGKDKDVIRIKKWGVKYNKVYKEIEEELMIKNKW